MIQSSTINFLKSLSKNNNKAWFDTHRDNYTEAKRDFELFITDLIKKTSSFDSDIKPLSVKDCTFRINRDIRFAKDKTPYKINMGASLNKAGKKSLFAGYYFHLEPGNKSFAGGGIWMPATNELKKIRQEIDYSYEEFISIITSKKFKIQYGNLANTADVKLANLPRGYEKTNPASEYLKLKSILAIRSLKDSDVVESSLIIQITDAFKALKPLINFINQALE